MLQLLQMQTFIYLQSKLYFWDTMWKETKLKLLIHKELLYMPKCSPGATKKWIKSNETRHQAHEMKRVVQRGGAQRELFGKRNKLSMHPSIEIFFQVQMVQSVTWPENAAIQFLFFVG